MQHDQNNSAEINSSNVINKNISSNKESNIIMHNNK